MTAPWTATVLTIYPEMFPGPLAFAPVGRALSGGLWALDTLDIRDFARDKHRSVDDTPAGGGPGMVMRADVVSAAVDAALAQAPAARPVLCFSPRGAPLTQARVKALRDDPGAILLCGRFEGIDERFFAARAVEEVSLGDFVLSGGEFAAFALIDAVARLLPGVVGDTASLTEESFEGGLLEYPQYTRPQDWEGYGVPEVLTSGHHERIREWRRHQAEAVTKARRPDLFKAYEAGRNESSNDSPGGKTR